MKVDGPYSMWLVCFRPCLPRVSFQPAAQISTLYFPPVLNSITDKPVQVLSPYTAVQTHLSCQVPYRDHDGYTGRCRFTPSSRRVQQSAARTKAEINHTYTEQTGSWKRNVMRHICRKVFELWQPSLSGARQKKRVSLLRILRVTCSAGLLGQWK